MPVRVFSFLASRIEIPKQKIKSVFRILSVDIKEDKEEDPDPIVNLANVSFTVIVCGYGAGIFLTGANFFQKNGL